MHVARTKVAGSKVRASISGGAGTDTLDLRVLYGVLADYQRGNFTVRMPDDRTGLAGKISGALQMIKEGRITDGKTVVGLLFAAGFRMG